MSTAAKHKKKDTQYAKLFSSLFCSMSILTLSILCLLNSLSIDLYSTTTLLMVVVPGALCFWLLGFTMGKILDTGQVVAVKAKKVSDDKAYEIPSMFSSMDSIDGMEDEFGEL